MKKKRQSYKIKRFSCTNIPHVKSIKKIHSFKEDAKEKLKRLKLAKEEVLSGKLTQRKVAKVYDLPRTSLRTSLQSQVGEG